MLYLYIAIVLVIILFIFLYNKIVKLKNMMQEAFSGVDIQLKRRYDLVPNLARIVKEYSEYEKELFENIENMKIDNNLSSIKEINQKENQFEQSFKNIIAIVENYPELKANENFLKLQNDLVDIEDQLQYARRYYNGLVRTYNITIQSFPGNIIAAIIKLEAEEYFEIECISHRTNAEVNI